MSSLNNSLLTMVYKLLNTSYKTLSTVREYSIHCMYCTIEHHHCTHMEVTMKKQQTWESDYERSTGMTRLHCLGSFCEESGWLMTSWGERVVLLFNWVWNWFIWLNAQKLFWIFSRLRRNVRSMLNLYRRVDLLLNILCTEVELTLLQ